MSKIQYDICYREDGEVMVPDIEITSDNKINNYEALRGYGYILAVFDIDDKCIGWIKTSTLGLDSAKEFLEKGLPRCPKKV